MPENETPEHSRNISPLRFLVVGRDVEWVGYYCECLEVNGHIIERSDDHVQADRMVDKTHYHIVVCDTSIGLAQVLELLFNTRDSASRDCLFYVFGPGVEKYEDVWEHEGVYCAAGREEAAKCIAQSLERVQDLVVKNSQ